SESRASSRARRARTSGPTCVKLRALRHGRIVAARFVCGSVVALPSPRISRLQREEALRSAAPFPEASAPRALLTSAGGGPLLLACALRERSRRTLRSERVRKARDLSGVRRGRPGRRRRI